MVPVQALGHVKLNKQLVLDQVLGIPNFNFNLLSVSKLTKDLNCVLTFWPTFCVIQDLPSRRPIGVGRVRDGLYYLEPIREGKALMASNMRHADMWHRRLGHLPMNRLSFIGDLSINVKENKFCDACCRARQHRLPFFASTYESSRIFELIHCDIWGDYKTPSLFGPFYFLTIVDDYSRAT